MKRFIGMLTVAFSAVIAVLTMAAPASADPGQYASVEIVILESGEMVEKSEYETLDYDEGYLTNGTLSVYTQYCDIVTVDFYKSGGYEIRASLGYVSGIKAPNAAYETMNTGDRITETWNNQNLSGDVIGAMTVTGQRTFYTPAVRCD